MVSGVTLFYNFILPLPIISQISYKFVTYFTLGTDGDDESEESDSECNKKMPNKKSSKQSKTVVKSSSNGDELKQSLTQLLNPRRSAPKETSASKSISKPQDEAWVEVSIFSSGCMPGTMRNIVNI